MKRLPSQLIIVGLLSIIPVIALYSNHFFKLKSKVYHFTRKFIPIDKVRRIDLKYEYYYIAGQSKGYIYLGNYNTSLHLLQIDSLLSNMQNIAVMARKKDLVTDKGNYKILVDSNIFFLHNAQAHSILLGKVGTWSTELHQIKAPYFHEIEPIKDQSLVFRYISAVTNMNSLRKESFSSPRIEKENMLEKQVDGQFCTSGILNYNGFLNKLIYQYYYRNQILILDTNLNLLKKMKTIDPIDSARITVGKIKSDKSSVITSALLVNIRSCTWNKYLFVESKLMGLQEDDKRFELSTVIDIYNVSTGRYLSSVYLPKKDNKPVKDFQVIDGHIYAVTDHFLTRYEISLPQ